MNNILQKQTIDNFIRVSIACLFILGSIVFDAGATESLKCDANFILQVQQSKVTVNMKNKTLDEIMSAIRKQTKIEYGFDDKLNAESKFSLQVSGATLEEALTKLLAGTNLDYSFVNNRILIKEKKAEPQGSKKVAISGKVVDKLTKKPIVGATVLVANSNEGAITDEKGDFKLSAFPQSALEVSYVGKKTINYLVKSSDKVIAIEMEEDAMDLDNVIVTGYFNRKMDSYTGNATVVKGADLRAVNPTNVMKALSFLDPDIVIQENNEMGSDPNSPPSIHIQGTSSVGGKEFAEDPNMPTFILDGFEVKYKTIYDMDPSRIESIVVLKDAAATAVYGSRASNGVVVVTTVEPKPGKIDLSYNLNLEFSSPDLSSYDLLNAREKFELENSLGVRTPTTSAAEYNQIRKWLAGGVDTDWLAQPTRNAVTQSHTVNLMGGEKGLRYNLNFNFKDTPGVMKGSKRSVFSVSNDIIYRPSDKLNFKNSITYSRSNGTTSPYGSFDTYTRMNPYFPIYDEKGNTIPVYQSGVEGAKSNFPGEYKNPIYMMEKGGFGKEKYSEFLENFSVDWMFHKDLRLKLTLSYSEQNSQRDQFISPNATDFMYEEDKTKVGSYTITNGLATNFNGKVSLGYNKYVRKHNINANIGYEMNIANNESFSHTATGFGSDYLNYINFAAKYQENSTPMVTEGRKNTLGGYFSVNYTFDNRFLFDGSFRFDGSSQFGSEKRIAPFFSCGIGWNIHNEKFFKENNFINQLKVRATFGQTGSVEFLPYQAKDTYTYFKDDRYMDNIGIYVLALGNENLVWQKTDDCNVGFNGQFFENILSLSFNYYYKQTNDLLHQVMLPSSTGFKSYAENLGRMVNQGITFQARANVIRKESGNMSIFVNGSQNKNKSYAQYKNGDPVTAIYAVPSLGIDPATGQELYLDKAGNPTWTYDIDNKRIFGDTAPKMQGSFGLNATYKDFSASIGFSYSIGSQEYNSTLESKVENASIYNNVDRRVLTDTWQKKGDNAKYGHPLGAVVQSSSRFVQENDYLKFSSFNLTYDFKKDGFIKRVKLTSLQLTFNTSDLAYWSTIQRERGTSYPFARSYTLGLRANF